MSVEKALSVLRETIPGPDSHVEKGWSGWNPSDLGIGIGNGADTNTWLTLTKMLGLTPQNTISLVEAFQIMGATACGDAISQDIAKSTLRMWERLDDGGRKLVRPKDHVVARLLAEDPNEEHTWDEVHEMAVRQFVFTQNAYFVKGLSRRGEITEVIPVLTLRVYMWVDPQSGMKWFTVTRGSNFERAMLRDYPLQIPQENIIHIRGRMVDGVLGYSTLVAGNESFGLAKDVQGYQRRLYSSDARQHGVFELPEEAEFGDAEFKRLREQVTKAWQKMRTENYPMILEKGAAFKAINMTASDSEVAKVRNQALLEVCSLFRVPPYKIGFLEESKYSNIEAQERIYVDTTLVPIARRMERRLEREFLVGEDRHRYFFEFDREEMVAMDAKTRAQIAKDNVQTGQWKIDEGRRFQRMDPLPNGAGDVRSIAVNTTLIDDNNKVVVQGASGQPQGENGKDTKPNDDATDESGSVVPMKRRA